MEKFCTAKSSWRTAQYVPSDYNKIFDIMNLLEDRLQHANDVVVLATIKCFQLLCLLLENFSFVTPFFFFFVFFFRGKYTLPTCGLTYLHFAYLWFQT
jgi:hypothetical protein